MCSCPNPQIVLSNDDAINASSLATILQKNGFSAEFFGNAQEALAAAQSKALNLIVSDLNTSSNLGDDVATHMRMQTMNSGQEIDHAYQEERLLALLDRRQKLPATSDLMPDLETEILAVWDLVMSCRMVQARLYCEAAPEPIEASSNHLPHIQVDDAKKCAPEAFTSEMQEVPAD